MTKREIIYDIYNLLRPKAVDDEVLSTRQISQQIDNARAFLVRREYQKHKFINPDTIQSLGCIKVIQVDASECNCPIDCTVLRTECPIPLSLVTTSDNMITRVGPVNTTSRPYQMVNYHRVPYLNSNPFVKDTTHAVLHNNYIYLIGGKQLESVINVQGVWEDPGKVSEFYKCDGEACYDEDFTDYPVSLHLVDTIKQLAMQNYANYFNMPNDEKGNSADDKPSDIE